MFYERFIALCKDRNIKPTAVADAIGLSRTNASFWKKGSMPSAANLQKLAEYFNVPLDYLIGTQNQPKTNKSGPEKIQELVSNAEIEKDRIMLENLLKETNEIPKQYQSAAIHEIIAFTQFTLHKYKST